MGEGLNAWLGLAACKDADPDLFTLHEYEGTARDKAFRSENEDRMNLGLAYCRRCPVVLECGDAASPEDFKNTVRAGRTPYSESPVITAANKRTGQRAWDAYRTGQKVLKVGPAERAWFNILRGAHTASTPEVAWPKYRTSRNYKNYQQAGRGVPLYYHEERGVYTVMRVGGKRADRLTIEAKHVVWDVPVEE